MSAAANPYDSPEAQVERPTRVRYQVMAFLCVLSFLTYYDRVCIMQAQKEIQTDLGISDPQMGLVLGIFWFAYAIFEIPGGWLGDRYGSRGTLVRIVLAWSLFTALSGSAWSFASLLLMRFLFGAGEAGAYPNMARVQANWLPTKARARAGGLLWLTARWGGAAAPLIFSMLMVGLNSATFRDGLNGLGLTWLASVASWRLGFWISGMIGLVWVAAFYPWFRDNPADKETVNAAELHLINEGRDPHAADKHSASRDVWISLFTCRSLWAMALLYVCGSFAWSFFVSWMPKFLDEERHISFDKSAYIALLPAICGGISCLVGGLLSDWLVKRSGRKRLFRALFPICGMSTAAASMFLIPHVDSILPNVAANYKIVALMCLAYAAHDFGQGANWATIIDIGGSHSGIAAGFNNMIGNTGNAIQPFIGALIFNRFGWDVLFVVYSCAFLGAASMWFFINPNRTFYEGRGGHKAV